MAWVSKHWNGKVGSRPAHATSIWLDDTYCVAAACIVSGFLSASEDRKAMSDAASL